MGGLWKNDLLDHQPELFGVKTKCRLCGYGELTNENGICDECLKARKTRCNNGCGNMATNRDGRCDPCRVVCAAVSNKPPLYADAVAKLDTPTAK